MAMYIIYIYSTFIYILGLYLFILSICCLFNPSKCVYLKITNKLHSISTQYHIQKHTIKEVTHATYLGVIIDQHLTWNEHTNYITFKANKVKCFLQRNLKSCPTTVKTTCYNSLIRFILDYASIIWSPYTQKTSNQLSQ